MEGLKECGGRPIESLVTSHGDNQCRIIYVALTAKLLVSHVDAIVDGVNSESYASYDTSTPMLFLSLIAYR